MLFKRAAAVLALVFGMAGMACCLAGAYGVWLVESRLDRANDKVFDAVDRSLDVVGDRMSIVQQRVKESKITTKEVVAQIPEWAVKRGQDRIVSALQIESKVEKLSGHLRSADARLEASRMAVRDIRQVLELSQGLGARVDPASVDAVQELLVSLQDTLQRAERAVDDVGKLAALAGGDDLRTQVAELLARILLTLSEVDRRLDEFVDRLVEIQAAARQWKAKTSLYIVLGSLVCYGLVAWGMAGQAALCGWGWSSFRRRPLPAGQTALCGLHKPEAPAKIET